MAAVVNLTSTLVINFEHEPPRAVIALPSSHFYLTMKKYIVLPLLLLGLVATASAQSTIKVGIIDMKKVFENYYKTKDAEARITEARNAAKKELEDRVEVFEKKKGDVKKLQDDI